MSTSAAQRGSSPSSSSPPISASPAVSDQVVQAEWDGYVSAHPDATIDHRWGWREVFTRVFGHRCAYLAARRDGRIVGVLPLVVFHSRLFGRFVTSVPFLNYGGLLADDEDVAEALVGEARRLAAADGATHVELRHVRRHFEQLPYRQHKLGFRLALPATSEALWTSIDRKIRNQVRKAQKEGLVVAVGGAELVDEFYGVFSRNMRDLGTPVYSIRLFRETLAQFPGEASVFLVRKGTLSVAGAIAIGFRDTMLVPWASSLREFRNLSPNTLQYWSMLERATTEGRRVFDFGRSSPGGGTHQFKLQWGCDEIPLHWEYVMLSGGDPPNQGPTNPKFAAAIELWKRLPLWIANRCGPHLARHLP